MIIILCYIIQPNMNVLFSVKRYASYGIYKVLQFPKFYRVTRYCLTRALVPDRP